MRSAAAYVVLASLMLAGCEPVPPEGRMARDAAGNRIVILSPAEVAAANRPNPARQPMRMTRDGRSYLVQMRETELPSPPPVDDDPDDGIPVVDDLVLRIRYDLAVSRAASAFTLDDRAEAEAVALDVCGRMGWTLIRPAERLAPQFRPVNAPGDSNEWILPNWCSPEPAEGGA